MKSNKRTFATHNIVLRTNRTNKLGEHPICIKITKDGKTSIASTIYSADKKHWNDKLQRPHRKHPEYEELTNYLDECESVIKGIIVALQRNVADYTATDVTDKFKSPTNSTPTVKSYYEKFIQRLQDKQQYSTYYTYKSAFAWLDKFRPLDRLTFAEINNSLFEDLRAYIKRENPEVQGSTLFGYFKNYKAFMRSAINEDIIAEGTSNFHKFSLATFKTESTPLTLSKENINDITKLDLEPYTAKWNARNYFLFSFFSGGINLVDMAKLTNSDILNGRISYQRSKSDVICKFKLNEKTSQILNAYKGHTYANYLFPILNKSYTQKQLFTRIKTACKQINRSLKEIGKDIEIENLHFYAARHSIATTMKFMEIPTNAISETIGHANERTTKKYLRRFHDTKLEELNDRVYNSVINLENRLD